MYLQVALYCRHDLNLRSPTNLLLAFASLYRPCRPYLPRYFSACLNIPADWISVADYVQTFYSDKVSEARIYISPGNNETEKQVKNEDFFDATVLEPVSSVGSLPAVLRKVMTAKFADFDEYQLAKYNRQARPQKKVKNKVCVLFVSDHKTD